MNLKNFFRVWGKVFGKNRYIIYAIIVIFVFYLINVIIFSYQNIKSIYYLKGLSGITSYLPIFFVGFRYLLTRESLVIFVIITISIGILFSLIFYRVKMIKEASGTFGLLPSIGIFLGMIAPGCAACGLGILPLLGVSTAFLISLPLKGLEFSLLALMIISFSIFKITKDIYNGVFCKVTEIEK